MTTLTPIDAQTVAARLKTGAATLIDIREADEYAREHIASAVSLPLASWLAKYCASMKIDMRKVTTSSSVDSTST